MKVLAKQLKAALAAAKRIAGKKSDGLLSDWVKLEAGDHLVVTVARGDEYDEDNGSGKYDSRFHQVQRAETILATEASGDQWSAVVSLDTLKAAMPSKPRVSDTIELTGADDGVNLTLAGGTATLPSIADEFPAPIVVADPARASFTKTHFARMIECVAGAMSTEVSRFTLGAIQLEINNRGARATATDGHRIHRTTVPAQPSRPVEALVPGVAVKSMKLDAPFKATGTVQIAWDKETDVDVQRAFEIKSRLVTYTFREPKGNFPNVDRIFGTKTSTTITTEAGVIADSLKTLKPFWGKKARAVRLDISGAYPVVSARTENREGSAVWNGSTRVLGTFEGQQIGINPDYLGATASLFPGNARMTLAMLDADNNVRLACDSDPLFEAVIMPIRL